MKNPLCKSNKKLTKTRIQEAQIGMRLRAKVYIFCDPFVNLGERAIWVWLYIHKLYDVIKQGKEQKIARTFMGDFENGVSRSVIEKTRPAYICYRL